MDKLAHLQECLQEAPRVARLPRDSRGLPIPYVVLRDPEGRPDFVVNDAFRQMEAAHKGLCNVCGMKMSKTDTWFLGGPKSAFDPRGVYNDGPMHLECAHFALKVCPYLAMSRYAGMKEEARNKLLQSILDRGALGVDDPTMDPTKPQMFVAARVNGLALVKENRSIHVRYIPNRPFEQVEIWKDGKMVGEATKDSRSMDDLRAMGIAGLSADRMTLFDIHMLQYRAWTDGFNGEWPW